ncbi:hypothetical protein A3G14_00025 [Candidatus Curtissbacteria bacterium RIFCSPLOWO2_12_FULL_38_9]|uniref:Uncharacterized protein n=2 Tax=Candidatus Curtissiibacteriota TaxID=1752717 RepID=A0A1F5G8R2_9BACT|nr:MAG: hypothetical protein A3D04_05105 [Candidatus Curtissbacteria bacterium RIFCSPHIGHO2_02_FULL_40_16b]OGE13820.1 MAG: hypothetical protein A3G14_00025 [Candidatus Curtissbacteria bacterium RIFCSPLOWO2_12_FULL_38_9]
MVEAITPTEPVQITQDSRGARENPITFYDLPQDILEVEDVIFDTEDNVFVIEFGNKVLNLQLDQGRSFILARSGLFSYIGREKREGDTTRVYKVAREVMQRVAVYLHEPVLYSLFTANEGMEKWALDPNRGAGIFKWHSQAKAYRDNNRFFQSISVIDPEKLVLTSG